jgi:hypothetical protein
VYNLYYILIINNLHIHKKCGEFLSQKDKKGGEIISDAQQPPMGKLHFAYTLRSFSPSALRPARQGPAIGNARGAQRETADRYAEGAGSARSLRAVGSLGSTGENSRFETKAFAIRNEGLRDATRRPS